MKRLKDTILWSLLLGMIVSASAPGQAAKRIKVMINDKEIYFANANPITVNGRTLVAMRPIFEGFGMKVDWEGRQKKITSTRGQQEIIMWIARRNATNNGKTVALDAPPILRNGRTYVPLRFIGEALGANVKWNAGTQTVSIADPGGESVSPTMRLAPQLEWRGVITTPANGAVISEFPGVEGKVTAWSVKNPIRRLLVSLIRHVDGGFQYWNDPLKKWDNNGVAAINYDNSADSSHVFTHARKNFGFDKLPPGTYTIVVSAVHTNYHQSTVATSNFTIDPNTPVR